MVVHQPRYSLFTLFDEVLLLGLGGETVYLGASEGALPYFRNLGFKMPEHEIFGGMAWRFGQKVGVHVCCLSVLVVAVGSMFFVALFVEGGSL